eukprot:scaffold32614_cov69-Phaeocystis_antarctica.AAC.2
MSSVFFTAGDIVQLLLAAVCEKVVKARNVPRHGLSHDEQEFRGGAFSCSHQTEESGVPRVAAFEAEDGSEFLPGEPGGVSVCQHLRLLVMKTGHIAPTARAVLHEHREHRSRASLLSPEQVELWHAATTAAHGRA